MLLTQSPAILEWLEERSPDVDRCPHAGVTLARVLDDYLTPARDLIACSWHGALFRVEDGRCVGGPCIGAALTPWPVAVGGGVLRTA